MPGQLPAVLLLLLAIVPKSAVRGCLCSSRDSHPGSVTQMPSYAACASPFPATACRMPLLCARGVSALCVCVTRE